MPQLLRVQEYRHNKRPFPPAACVHPVPCHLAAHPAPPGARPPPRQRASGQPALPAAGPRCRARPGRGAGDGPPARLGLLLGLLGRTDSNAMSAACAMVYRVSGSSPGNSYTPVKALGTSSSATSGGSISSGPDTRYLS